MQSDSPLTALFASQDCMQEADKEDKTGGGLGQYGQGKRVECRIVPMHARDCKIARSIATTALNASIVQHSGTWHYY